MKILLLSAYHAKSHQYWSNGLVENLKGHQWKVLTLPARFYSWRVRGNSLSWAYSDSEILKESFDLIIATSMTDLSSLIGLAPQLANIPSVLYFHENQFAYPLSGHEFSSVEPQITSIYSALAATKIVFNSEYNRTTFLCGAQKLLKRLPDHVPRGLISLLSGKSSVLPVPLLPPLGGVRGVRNKSSKLQVLWNHRWEFDKGGELLYRVIERLSDQKQTVKFHIAGQSFREVPDIFKQILSDFPDLIATFGYIEDIQQYYQLLMNIDVVLSTAKHDFQGLSILEAAQYGAIPLVPNRLAYPEFLPECCLCDLKHIETEDIEAISIANKLNQYIKLKSEGELIKSSMIEERLHQISWITLKSEYENLITEAVIK